MTAFGKEINAAQRSSAAAGDELCLLVENLGRFWEIGPQRRLYVPAPLLKTGTNEIIIFETEGKTNSSIEFFAEHKL